MISFYETKPEIWHARRSIGYLALRTHKLLLARVEPIFAEHGITFVQWASLMLLRDGIVRTASDISRHLYHDSGALTRMLDLLEQRGFIDRRRCGFDRRAVDLSLTEAGWAAAERLIPPVATSYNAALEGLSYPEQETLVRLLTKLIFGMAEPPEVEGSVAAHGCDR